MKKCVIYIVIKCEVAIWRHCKCLVEFCVTKTTDVWEEVCDFDREVNCVDVFRLYTEHCSIIHTRHFVIRCHAEDKFNPLSICSNVTDYLKS